MDHVFFIIIDISRETDCCWVSAQCQPGQYLKHNSNTTSQLTMSGGSTLAFRASKNDLAAANTMFIVGCFFLPWIWALCAMHYWEKAKDPSEIGKQLKTITLRSLFGCVVWLVIILTWIILFQTQYKNWGISTLLVFDDQANRSTW